MTTYYTYKDDVPLLPGQTLAFTPGRGYYAKGTPTPNQATRQTTAAPSTVDRPTAPAAPPPPPPSPQPAPSYTDVSSGGGYSPAPPQPQPAPTSPSNAAQVARQTAAAPASVDRPAGASAQPKTTPVNTATNFPSEHGQGGGSSPSDTGVPPTARETEGGYASPASSQPSPASSAGPGAPPPTPVDRPTVPNSGDLHPVQPGTDGAAIPAPGPGIYNVGNLPGPSSADVNQRDGDTGPTLARTGGHFPAELAQSAEDPTQLYERGTWDYSKGKFIVAAVTPAQLAALAQPAKIDQTIINAGIDQLIKAAAGNVIEKVINLFQKNVEDAIKKEAVAIEGDPRYQGVLRSKQPVFYVTVDIPFKIVPAANVFAILTSPIQAYIYWIGA